MPIAEISEALQSFEIAREEVISAPIDVVFETLVEQIGQFNEKPDGTPLPMKLELWPGGRWYRDLGNNTGHFWGNVQAIKPPTLLEICGPLFMSTPAVSNVQYRLSAEGNSTRLKFSHRAAGVIPPDLRDGSQVNGGWSNVLGRIKTKSEERNKKGK